MIRKRTVLIISYHYLPEVMAGSYRIHAWAKYLPRFGWEPIILTRYRNKTETNSSDESLSHIYKEIDENINCIVYRAPFKQSFEKIWNIRTKLTSKVKPSKLEIFIRRALSFIIRNFLMIPDEKVGWYQPAYKAGLHVIKKHDVEIILSTGGPWTDFKIASVLSKATGIPWIADYRDPWTQRTTLGIRKEYVIWFFISRAYESRIAKSASGFIQIAEPLRNGLMKTIHREIHLIRNGFDPEKFERRSQYLPSKKIFTISFIGTLHTNTRTDMFFEGFHRFVRAHRISPSVCRVEFIGDTVGYRTIEQDYDGFGDIAEFITFYPSVSQEEANEMMCRSHLLLSFPLDMRGCCPAKTYEYLASRRPILVSPDGLHRGVIREILEKTKGGVILNSPEEIADWLGMKFREFQDTGHVKSSTDWSAVQEYSRERQVRVLAQILEEAVAP